MSFCGDGEILFFSLNIIQSYCLKWCLRKYEATYNACGGQCGTRNALFSASKYSRVVLATSLSQPLKECFWDAIVEWNVGFDIYQWSAVDTVERTDGNVRSIPLNQLCHAEANRIGPRR
jgi:hypothetical protein